MIDYQKFTAYLGLSLCTTLSVALVVLNKSGPQGGYWTILGIGYAFFYAYFLFISRTQPSLAETSAVFLYAKLCLLIFFIEIGYFQTLIPDTQGDPTAYHMPTAIGFYNSGGFFEYLLFSNIFNGKMTHLLLLVQVWFLDSLGYDYSDMRLLGFSAFVVNVFILQLSIIIFYKAILNYAQSINYARRFIWFIAMNPIFISNTSAAKKEALLFLAVALFFYFLFSKNKFSLAAGAISFIVLLFDRFYMIPLLGLIFALHKRLLEPKNLLILAIGVVFLLSYFDIQALFEMLDSHQRSLTSSSVDGSILRGEHSHWANALRALFSPFPFRNMDLMTGPDIAFDMAIPYIYFMVYLPVVLFSILDCKGVERSFLIVIVFCFVFIPFHSTFKMFMFACVGGFVVEKISIVKFKKAVMV